LTKTLPTLDKALIQGLLNQKFCCPRQFKRAAKGSSIPAFLQGYFKLVFSESDGSLLPNPPEHVVRHIREICGFVYKLKLPFSLAEKNAVIANFEATEEELGLVKLVSNADVADAADLTEQIFGDFDPKDIMPKHGPGSVASGEKGEAKWTFSTRYNAIHQEYPYYSYFMVGRGLELIDRLAWYKNMQRQTTGGAKVVLVPKDSRGPRMISMEPLEYMWLQGGLGRSLQEWLEHHSMTAGHVNFSSQMVNRSLALTSSKDGSYATLDLKDASDRVTLDLVKRVFGKTPELLRCLLALRTTTTLLPNGKRLTLKKYAPMGSALCFPVEAYIFWVVIVAAISRRRFHRPKDISKLVYVYGDDIIVPTKYAKLARQALERVGLKVNVSKSCTTGNFRESCGMDAFNGVDVTPTRLRVPWSGKASDGSALASYSSLANSFERKGYMMLSSLLWKMVDRTYGLTPYGTSFSSYPCKVVSSAYVAEELNKLAGFRYRWNADLQRIEFKLRRVVAARRPSILDSWSRMLRNVTATGKTDNPSEYVVPNSTRVKLGWSAIY
jgi:hypothetical protein